MDKLPERSDAQARLRASDQDRDQVVDALREALMTGRLTQDEHAERLEQALAARTLGELEPITHDLPVPGAFRSPAAGNGRVPIEAPAGAQDRSDVVVGVFGGGQRGGRWRVRRRTTAIALFGGCELDMTGAVFESREVTVRAITIFGGIEVVVPPGVELRDEGIGIMGGFGVSGDRREADPAAPVVVLKGFALFGGVGARVQKPKKKTEGGQLES